MSTRSTKSVAPFVPPVVKAVKPTLVIEFELNETVTKSDVEEFMTDRLSWLGEFDIKKIASAKLTLPAREAVEAELASEFNKKRR